MIAAWSSPSTRITAAITRDFQPGVGPDRYLRALNWLRESGLPVALAAFTFDPDEPQSIVVAPTGRAGPPEASPLPEATVVSDGRAHWEKGFDQARAALESGEVKKVVLARRVELGFEEEFDASGLWRRLVEANPDAYCFLVDGLVGASPELLARVEGDRIDSLVLAGTRPAGQALSGELIDVEHRHAADSVAASLGRLATELSTDRGTHDFGGLRHVGTRFRGRLSEGVTILDVLAAIHPTAAVGGTPSERAMRLIRRIEGPRGRYAGPVGWFDANGDGEFAIALRCGQVTHGRLVLHAGGGLLKGSDRDREWDETNLKLRPMMEALGLES